MPANFGTRALDAPWLKSGPAARVLKLLNGNGEEARVVGGAVRNALLNLPIGDIDVATTALPEEVSRRARAAGIKSVPTGIEHGTVTLVIELASARGNDPAGRHRDLRPQGEGRIRTRLGTRRRAARLHHQRPVRRR